jgi:hypothetical protein
MRPSRNPSCGALPLLEAAGVRPDTAAGIAHDLGLGPDPRHGMSNIARQQGDTWDETLFADGRPLLDALVRDAYFADHDVDILNISDHVDPTRAADGTPAARGGRTTDKDQRERERVTYNRARARITAEVMTAAVDAERPTLVLRSVLEATAVLGSAIPTFLELDFTLIIPEGRCMPDAAPARVFGDGPVIIIGDGKSWRRLGRLDNGDKRAEAARQVAAYLWVAVQVWPAVAAVAVAEHGLVANPPGGGGLSTVRLTRLDLRDHCRALAAQRAAAHGQLAGAQGRVAAAVAGGASLTPPNGTSDPDSARRGALQAILAEGYWLPSCLSGCPMGGACRRHAEATGQIGRLGGVAEEAGPVASLERLSRLRRGVVSPTQTEADVVERLARAETVLGPDPALPWERAR